MINVQNIEHNSVIQHKIVQSQEDLWKWMNMLHEILGNKQSEES